MNNLKSGGTINLSNVLKTLMLIIFFTSIKCSKDYDPEVIMGHDFAIYLLKDSLLKIGDILTKELSEQDPDALASIEIQQNPWITKEDVDFYDFSSHIIYLKKDKSFFLPKSTVGTYPPSWSEKPFMVVSDSLRRYIGVFHSSFFWNQWPVPYIEDFKNWSIPMDLMYISWIWFGNDLKDTRNDAFVKGALIGDDIFRKGLNVTLNKVIITENSDTSSVRYTYTITNNDIDNLYVIDPEKMGGGLFHYYNNGPVFESMNDGSMYESNFKKVEIPQPHSYWNPGWFTKINSGKSLTRTVNLKGYPFFPKGPYYCQFSFQCIYQITKEQRILSDGRYWIGPTKSNLITIKY